ncbi:MAG: LytTR family transcriptional regulator [Atopobiaceae bacterium]|jgi:ketosteroid isomerase-like protein|nr:LytTR family transcriptional regulator DNA-binding domain-containing protein [Atopobiaceae bacterium]
MLNSAQRRAEQLTGEFVHAYWDGDIDRVETMLADDFMWIGAQEDEYALSRDAAVEQFHAIARNFRRVILAEEEYHCIFSSGNVHVVLGQYLGYTDPQLEMLFAARQRLTLLWREGSDGTMLLAHYHVSNPLDAVEPGEKFPKRYAQETFKYVNALATQRGVESTYRLRDMGGVDHLVKPFDIEYLEADRKLTVVHCSEGSFSVRMGISGLVEKLSGDKLHCFVRVHKSYALNALFVVNFTRTSAIMVSGAEVPLSPGNASEVRERIGKARLA